MHLISRELAPQIDYYLTRFPIVSVMGPRQCGKTTLLRELLPHYRYVSLEEPAVRGYALSDPRGFLQTYAAPCIIDEAPRAPQLFSYLQTKVDLAGEMGAYILSGSHNFLLLQSVSQSLAGRAAVLTLAPLSIAELKGAGLLPEDNEEIMLRGGYPALYDRGISPEEFFPGYLQTYVERDVRLLRNIPDADLFMRFVRLCATRAGQTVNHAALAQEAAVAVTTVRAWLAVLRQSCLIFTLQPYLNNYSKRIVKSPKLYFCDTALLCHLLGIVNVSQLREHPLLGAIFENLVVADYLKSRWFAGKDDQAYFWRDSNGNEVDLLAAEAGKLYACEIKSSLTRDQKYLKGVQKFAALAKLPTEALYCIYGGSLNTNGTMGSFVSLKEAFGPGRSPWQH